MLNLCCAVLTSLCTTVLRLQYRLEDRGIMVRFLEKASNVSLLQSIETDSETHPASYSVGTGSLLGGKAVEVKNEWSCTFLLHVPSLRVPRDDFTHYRMLITITTNTPRDRSGGRVLGCDTV
jgi:hypothetical protein